LKIRFFSFLLSVLCIFSMSFSAVAAETTEASVPVTLTIINTMKKVSVTVPASLPVSVIDGKVVVASNVSIHNNASDTAVQVTGIRIQSGSYTIGNFENYSPTTGSIALSINGCGTIGEGELPINDMAFPVIDAGAELPINYDAKVTAAGTVENETAAIVIFTLEAI